MKIDLGGVVLGAIIGIGAVLVLPKIANLLSGLHPGGYRSKKVELYIKTNLLVVFTFRFGE